MSSGIPDFLFEVSWEVCNKVGGINTVLKSKAALMNEHYRNYVLIGPYFAHNAALEFEEHQPPEYLRRAFQTVARDGIVCHYGTWQIKGEPDVILIDFSRFTPQKDKLKAQLWERYKIDSLGAAWDYEEPILFSAAVARLLHAAKLSARTVVHTHEWMTGATILFLHILGSPLRTVFTTHATMLGRAICGNGENLYEMLDHMDARKEAYKHGVQAKHLTEAAVAHAATVFTTVSEITGMEAEKILGRAPDVLVLNGLDIARFPTFEETSIKHLTCREQLREFLTYFFFPHYVFPLDHNLIFFLTGRFEFRNKGIDVTIEALGRLNELLKEQGGDRTVTCFLWVPMEHGGVKIELLENKSYYQHLKSYIQYNAEDILKKVLYDFLGQQDVTSETIFTKDFLSRMKRDLLHFKREGDPPLVTNYIPDEENNPIVKAIRQAGLRNRAEDRVKVILQPVYLDGNDGLIGLSYYDAIAGSHLGLFPSYYEPWGYTPLETAAMGVSALTTDLAGFGRFIEPHLDSEHPGIRILHRYGRKRADIIEEYAQHLLAFAQLSHEDRVQNKIAAKALSALCDWQSFIAYYLEAHKKALA
ncbi:hypothetical protein D6789_00755 [Candidatus Woesearchaeota archaeon]|nr:MAG: hypothetical protein D6789_00755 [Candidatus Woesearchaeota archaeon]